MSLSLNDKLINQEKIVKQSKFSQDSQNIYQYILTLREDKIKKLIKSTDDREMHILIGSIQSFDKLISSLTTS